MKSASAEPTVEAHSELPAPHADHAGRVARAAFVGNLLECYDYFLFGTAAAIVFNRLYFTTLDPTAATLAAFATFGAGFAARPIGAAFFGYIGDKIGRRPALLTTVVLIGIATGLVGCLPSYASIGIAAPIVLAVLRLLQGFALGGEWGGAVTMAVEHAPVDKRGRYAALVQLGSPFGTLMSSGAFSVVLLLPPDSFDSWGWRLPFLAAFPLLGVALYIRLKMEESPIFKKVTELEERAGVPLLELIRTSWGRLLVALAGSLLGVGGFYLMTTFVVSYGVGTLGLERQLMVNATLIAAGVQIVALLVAGRVAERYGPGRLTVWGGLSTAAAAFPLFWMIDTKNPVAVVFAVSLAIAFISIAYAVNGSLLTELFPPNVRYTGVALGYNLAGVISGFLPFIGVALLDASGGASWPICVLLAAIAITTAIGGHLGARMRLQDHAIAE